MKFVCDLEKQILTQVHDKYHYGFYISYRGSTFLYARTYISIFAVDGTGICSTRRKVT